MVESNDLKLFRQFVDKLNNLPNIDVSSCQCGCYEVESYKCVNGKFKRNSDINELIATYEFILR